MMNYFSNLLINNLNKQTNNQKMNIKTLNKNGYKIIFTQNKKSLKQKQIVKKF